jgi:hypothetical protein
MDNENDKPENSKSKPELSTWLAKRGHMENQSPALRSLAYLRKIMLVGLTILIVGCGVSPTGSPGITSTLSAVPTTIPAATSAPTSTAVPTTISAATSAPTSTAVPTTAPTATTVPLISDPKTLADNVYKASDPQARYQALLSVMRALNIGVYEPNRGKAILRGAERGPKDFYLYDFEVKTIANAMARGTTRDVAYLADFFTRAGLKPNGKPVDPGSLQQMLLDAVKSSAAAPADPYSLPYLLVRELGMKHASPYDMLHVSAQEHLQFDALQTFLIEADALVPEIRKQAALNQDGGRQIAMLCLPAQASLILAQQGPCDNMVGIGGITPFGKYLGGLLPAAAVGVLILDMLHGEALAYSVDVSAVTKSDSTHYGPQGHAADAGKEMRLKIKVKMLDDYGDTLVSCGKLAGWEFPKPGGIPGVGIIWDTGGLENYGTVTYEPPDKKTDADGIATLVFKPKDEKRPGQGPQVEEKGTVMGLATYQSAFGNIPGSVAQFLTPKSDIIAWTVARHKNLSLEVSMEGHFSDGDVTGTYGPNKVVIPLETQETTYVGTNKGEFTSTGTAAGCTMTDIFPVTFNVTATGTDPLDFSVQTSIEAGHVVHPCPGGEAGGSWPAGSTTRAFSLPAQDGASKIYDMALGGSGNLNVTFTLKEE